MRKIIIGKNSKLFLNFKSEFLRIFDLCLSHKDLVDFKFRLDDVILILSYPKSILELNEMKINLGTLRKNKVILLSTCSVVVNKYTKCYAYPRIKLLQEKCFSEIFTNLLIYRIGTVIRSNQYKKYIGTCILDSNYFFESLDRQVSIAFDKKIITSFKTIEFNGLSAESFFYNVYCFLIRFFSPYPCILRPFDLVLKWLGKPWYGYGALTKIITKETPNFDI